MPKRQSKIHLHKKRRFQPKQQFKDTESEYKNSSSLPLKDQQQNDEEYLSSNIQSLERMEKNIIKAMELHMNDEAILGVVYNGYLLQSIESTYQELIEAMEKAKI